MKKGLNRTLSVICKIVEILHWITAPLGLMLAALSSFDNLFTQMLAKTNITIPCYGFEVITFTQSGDPNCLAYVIAWLGAAVACVLIALIFRNIGIILHTISGRYEKANSTSPFQMDVVKRVKKISVFSIAIPVIGFVFSTIISIASLISGNPVASGVSLNFAIIGLIGFCLTQIFSYGAKLEEEVDGLL